MYGADLAQLRTLAQQFDHFAQQLDTDRMTVGNAIQISAWVGPFAASFRLRWESEHSRRLHAAAELLRTGALALRGNAADQERTSAVDSSSGSSGGRPRAHGGVGPWWNSLDQRERARLLEERPEVIGSMDGLPAAVRDEANRRVLERELARPCPADPAAAEQYRDRLGALTQLRRVLEAHPDSQLLLLDPSRYPVKVAVALGDVDSADHVAVHAQGVSSRAGKDDGLSGPVDQMADLRREAQTQLALAGRPSESIATVVWMGYEAPTEIIDGTQIQYAEGGSRSLASFADGLRANNPDAHMTALGHSYGSTVAGMAVQQSGAFDSLVVFGSPGVGTDDVADLRIDAGRFYVAEADWDPITTTGIHGGDPGTMSGGTHLKTDADGTLKGATGHSEYLDSGSTSQRNFAFVIAGLDDQVIV